MDKEIWQNKRARARTHAHTRGYLVCLIDVGPLVEQQLDDLKVAVLG